MIGTTNRRRLRLNAEARNTLLLLAFASPWLVGFLLFVLYPIAASAYYSFTDYNVLQPASWVGLDNYRYLLTADPTYRKTLENTTYYITLAVPLTTLVAFGLGVLVNADLRFRAGFRAVFLLPAVMPVVPSAMLWLWLLNARLGLVNAVLNATGMPSVGWLSNPDLAKLSLVLIACWGSGTMMLVFLAALQDVPGALYDAARVDGAGALPRLLHITVPMVTPAILLSILTGLIGASQYFTLAWLMTEGGPNNATEFYVVYLYRNAFRLFHMGLASAQAWLLFLAVAAVSVVIFRTSRRWVYYAGSASE